MNPEASAEATVTEAAREPGPPELRWGLPTKVELAKPGARSRWRRNAFLVVGQAVATIAVCLLLLAVTNHSGYRILAWAVLAFAVLETLYGVVLALWSLRASG